MPKSTPRPIENCMFTRVQGLGREITNPTQSPFPQDLLHAKGMTGGILPHGMISGWKGSAGIPNMMQRSGIAIPNRSSDGIVEYRIQDRSSRRSPSHVVLEWGEGGLSLVGELDSCYGLLHVLYMLQFQLARFANHTRRSRKAKCCTRHCSRSDCHCCLPRLAFKHGPGMLFRCMPRSLTQAAGIVFEWFLLSACVVE
jgi:hypothetical protein